MNHKKGFTLVEIIAVIVILIVVTLMAVPAILKMVKQNKKVSSESKTAIILKQAKQYARDHEEFLYNSSTKYIRHICNSITVHDLYAAGYLKELGSDGVDDSGHVIDPDTKEILDDKNIIVYIYSNDPYDSNDKYIGTYVSLFDTPNWCNSQQVVYEFNYTGEEQTFEPPVSGYYLLQVWGAQGGYQTNPRAGGRGGYAEGVVHLDKDETAYVYVGGSGNSGGTEGGFNGGGKGVGYNGGGGGTDVRVEGNTYYHRIIVAGGGGSSSRTDTDGWVISWPAYRGGAGGGLNGVAGGTGVGGTQTAPGCNDNGCGGFGYGGAAVESCGGVDGSGGGGWYGGSTGIHWLLCWEDGGAGGGSGFAYDGTNEVPEGYAVQNHVLTKTLLLSGISPDIPTHDDRRKMTGNLGDGFARITLVAPETD